MGHFCVIFFMIGERQKMKSTKKLSPFDFRMSFCPKNVRKNEMLQKCNISVTKT